jgi:hypothetical protein
MISPDRRRTIWVASCNIGIALSILGIFLSGLHSIRSFEEGLAQYGMPPGPLGTFVFKLMFEKWEDLLLAAFLVYGALAEARRRRVASVINPLLYSMFAARTIWDSIVVLRGPEFVLPLVLAQAVPFALVPILGLVLYRHEITRFWFSFRQGLRRSARNEELRKHSL